MTKFIVICTYCDYKSNQWVYTQSELESLRCYKCNDKNLKFQKQEDSSADIFGYESQESRKDSYIKKY